MYGTAFRVTACVPMLLDPIPAGLVYARDLWIASILAKFVGTEYQGKNASADGNVYKKKAEVMNTCVLSIYDGRRRLTP